MERWEYLTKFVSAHIDNTGAPRNVPKYSPITMTPELNALGEQGWEIVHMEPVYIGSNHDVLTHDYNAKNWTNGYFCVFKRRKQD